MSTTLSSIAPAMPAMPAIPPKQGVWFESRWREWEPWLVMEARRTPDPAGRLAAFKTTHRSRLISLLSAGVSWSAIRRHRIDNPSHSEALFEFQLSAAIERRRTRMGRVKGIHREKV